MNDVNVLKRYIEDFTLLLKRVVKPQIYPRCLVFPITSQGGVFEIHLESSNKTSIEVMNEFSSIPDCLNTLQVIPVYNFL